MGLYFSFFSRCTVCFGKTGDSGSVSSDNVPAFGVTEIEFISLLISQDSLVCFSIGKGPILILIDIFCDATGGFKFGKSSICLEAYR